MKEVRKESECLGGKGLVVSDEWTTGGREVVVFDIVGPKGGLQGFFEMTREDAGDLGRALVSLYGEG